MLDLLFAVGLIFFLLLAWVSVQRVAQIFSSKHPECSSAQEAGEGCSKSCAGCQSNWKK